MTRKVFSVKNIKIIVACHKASFLPHNPLLFPTQVGAKLSQNRMEGMFHDDEGDNISEKNASYCELTEQYWAWKNLDADYYGLCHYRRFLLFAKTEEKRNNRGQVEANAINDFTVEKFGLDNDTEMRKIIEANDVVCGPLQDVTKLYTPRGIKNTAWEHWTAHDRALIMVEDLEKMMRIFEGVSPEIAKDAREYLSKKQFLGFNCFVMKKELFTELCELEFNILGKLEKEVDLTNYCQQLKRIYGFMGEIICSSYIYHIEKQKKYKVKHLPLLYFNNTDLKTKMKLECKSIPIILLNKSLNFIPAVTLQSFIDNSDENTQYDFIIVSSSLTSKVKNMYLDMVRKHENFNLRFVDVDLELAVLKDKYGINVPFDVFLPYILSGYDQFLVFSSNLIFKKSVNEFWERLCKSEKIFLAPKNVLTLARLNDIYEDLESTKLRNILDNPYDYFSTEAYGINARKYRSTYSPECIIDLVKLHREASASDIINILGQGNCEKIAQNWDILFDSNDYLKYQLPYAPNDVFEELLEARKDPSIIRFMELDPFIAEINEIYIEYWALARKTPFYEKLLAHMSYLVSLKTPNKNKILDKLFPKHSKIRNRLVKLFPKTSKRREIMDNILDIVFR